MKKLNIVCGDLWSTSGYSLHAQNLIRELSKIADVAIETWQLPENWKESEFRSLIEKDYSREDTLMILIPDYWPMKSGDRIKKLIGYCVFEGDKIPYNWGRNIERGVKDGWLSKLFVPSNHTSSAVNNTMKEYFNDNLSGGFVSVIPHGVDTKVFNSEGPKLEQYNNGKFRFVFVGGWRDGENDRKGLDIALKAFCEEFKPEEDVEFVAKINMAYQSAEVVMANLEKLGLPPNNQRPLISVDLSQNAPAEYIASLYRSCNCAMFPSKAEAFLMPALEAMACGLPVIATNYGGQTDYLPKEGLIEIEKMIPATAEPIWYEHTNWALPSKDHLKKLMRLAFEGKIKGNNTIPTGFLWRDIAKRILNEFESS